MKNNLIKIYSLYILVFLFFISSIIPMVFGYNEESSWSSVEENKIYGKSISFSGPMNSPWPMKCHDTHHTGRSPYSTASNPGIEKWRFKCNWVEGGIVIGDDGTLYFGDTHDYFFALNPDGTLKWKYEGGRITSSPAIAEDGTIYVGSWDRKLYAFYPDGTLKWKESSGDGVYAIVIPPICMISPPIIEYWSHIKNLPKFFLEVTDLSHERKDFLIERFNYGLKWLNSEDVKSYTFADRE